MKAPKCYSVKTSMRFNWLTGSAVRYSEYSTPSPFARFTFLENPEEGKTAMGGVNTIWKMGFGETHET
jgi:hypothetical protein